MLILALSGVVVGFAFLVVSLVTQNSTWAWGTIVACVLAAGILVIDARRRRATASPPRLEPASGTVTLAKPVDAAAPGSAQPAAAVAQAPPELAAAVPTAEPAAAVPTADDAAVPTADDTVEPGEEDVDAADSIVVAGLAQDVLVVDEHPRFHLATCTWLNGKSTMSLPAQEAVELGFTPCSRCAPSRTLASLARTS